MVVVDAPHARQVFGLHVPEEVFAPQTLERNETRVASVVLHYRATVRHERLVQDSATEKMCIAKDHT